MRITELLTKETIAMDLSASDKNGVIDELVNQLDSAGKLSDIAQFKEAIHNRESQSTTGIGEGIAIPHAKVAAVKSPAIAFGKSKEGVDYQSLDGQPAHLFFMIAAPEGGAQTHLDALAKLSGILMDDKVREIYYRLIQKKKYFVLLIMLMTKRLKKKKKKLKSKRLKHKQQLVHQRMIMLTNLTF
ncbi:fructose-specific phosphotransferase system IIA component [Staphylococcus hominis]